MKYLRSLLSVVRNDNKKKGVAIITILFQKLITELLEPPSALNVLRDIRKPHRIIGIRCRRITRAVLANFLLTLAANPRRFLRREGFPADPAIVSGFRLPETFRLTLVKVSSCELLSFQFDRPRKSLVHWPQTKLSGPLSICTVGFAICDDI